MYVYINSMLAIELSEFLYHLYCICNNLLNLLEFKNDQNSAYSKRPYNE